MMPGGASYLISFFSFKKNKLKVDKFTSTLRRNIFPPVQGKIIQKSLVMVPEL
jgi:hypothetical protein